MAHTATKRHQPRARKRPQAVGVHVDRNLDCTPPQARKYARYVEYKTPDSELAASSGKAERERGFMFTLHPATRNVSLSPEGTHGEYHEVIPGMIDLYGCFYDDVPARPDWDGGTELDCWRASPERIEEFARALLEAVAKARAKGICA